MSNRVSSMKRIISKVVNCIILSFMLSGCATTNVTPTYNISIDSISGESTPPDNRCVVLSGMKDVDANDLQFKELGIENTKQ